MEERRGNLARRGCIYAILTLVVGVGVGVGLTLALLGLSWGVLAGRVFSPETAPVISVSATATPRPQAIQGDVAPGRRFTTRAPIPLDTDTDVPDVLLTSRNYDRNTSTLVYLSVDEGRARWESPPLSPDNDEYSWSIAAGDEVVVVAVGARLIGLNRATGAQLWEAPLTDSIGASICKPCLRVFGDVVVGLAEDGELQAFSLATGAPRWSVRLRETTRQIVAVGGLVGVLDSPPDDTGGSVLRLFEPADGAEQEAFRPTCSDRGGSSSSSPGYYNRVHEDPRGRLLVWIVGTSPPCLISFGTESRQLVGRVYLDGFNDYDPEPDQLLWAGDTLYLSDGAGLIAVDAQGVRAMTRAEDYRLSPLAASGESLVVLARRERGSSRFELWALDSASGARHWERVLDATDPLIGESDSGTFTAAIVGDALALLEQREEPEAMGFELIDLRDGTSRVRGPLGVEEPGDDMRGAVWGGKQLLLVTDEIYTVELATGTVRSSWP